MRTAMRVVVGAALLALASGCSGDLTADETSKAPAGARQDAAGNDAAAAAPQTDKQGVVTLKVSAQERHVIRTAELRVGVRDLVAAVRRAEQLAGASGGLVADEQITGKSAHVTLRIPPQALDGALRELSAQGTVLEQRRSEKDVTEEVVDVESRLASARASVERVRTLMGQAKSLQDVVLLEAELSKREAELESLEQRRKALAGQTELATVNVTFEQAERSEPVRTGLGGSFWGGLRTGLDGLYQMARGVLGVLGALLPFALLAAVLWWPAGRLARWARRRVQAGAPAPDQPAPPGT